MGGIKSHRRKHKNNTSSKKQVKQVKGFQRWTKPTPLPPAATLRPAPAIPAIPRSCQTRIAAARGPLAPAGSPAAGCESLKRRGHVEKVRDTMGGFRENSTERRHKLQSPRFKREDAYICSRTPMCVVEFGPPPLADAAWHVALFCLQAHAWSSRKRPREAKGRTHVIRKRRTKWGPGTSICIGHMLLFPLLAFRGNLSLLEIFYI